MELLQINTQEDKSKEIYSSEDCQNLLMMWEKFYPEIGFEPPWVGYFIKDGDKIIGTCAFTGKPANGTVEISYWTFKEFENKGIATWCCKQLISIAKNEDPSVKITAKTAPEKNASTSVLEKNGFVFSEIVQDHEIGDAWKWILE